jgi:hypothetical protein
VNRSVLALLAIALAAGCSGPKAPQLQLPQRTQANCDNRAVKQTAIESIVASTDDRVRPGAYPGDNELRRQILNVGGTFAWWPHQLVRMPETAKVLGLNGDPQLERVAMTNDVHLDEHWRPIWMTFKTPSGDRTVLERAYDIQNVCIEGQIAP